MKEPTKMDDIRGNELMDMDEVAFTEGTSVGLQIGHCLYFWQVGYDKWARVRDTHGQYFDITTNCLALIPPIDNEV